MITCNAGLFVVVFSLANVSRRGGFLIRDHVLESVSVSHTDLGHGLPHTLTHLGLD